MRNDMSGNAQNRDTVRVERPTRKTTPGKEQPAHGIQNQFRKVPQMPRQSHHEAVTLQRWVAGSGQAHTSSARAYAKTYRASTWLHWGGGGNELKIPEVGRKKKTPRVAAAASLARQTTGGRMQGRVGTTTVTSALRFTLGSHQYESDRSYRPSFDRLQKVMLKDSEKTTCPVWLVAKDLARMLLNSIWRALVLHSVEITGVRVFWRQRFHDLGCLNAWAL